MNTNQNDFHGDEYGCYGPDPVKLTHLKCYLCAHPSERMQDERTARWPLRRIVKTQVVGRTDPTETYTLACGHTII